MSGNSRIFFSEGVGTRFMVLVNTVRASGYAEALESLSNLPRATNGRFLVQDKCTEDIRLFKLNPRPTFTEL